MRPNLRLRPGTLGCALLGAFTGGAPISQCLPLALRLPRPRCASPADYSLKEGESLTLRISAPKRAGSGGFVSKKKGLLFKQFSLVMGERDGGGRGWGWGCVGRLSAGVVWHSRLAQPEAEPDVGKR